MATMLREPGESDREHFTRIMDVELAGFVKQLRCRDGYTWRSVGAKVHEEFPEIGIGQVRLNGECWVPQSTGYELCFAAMDFLGETDADGWN